MCFPQAELRRIGYSSLCDQSPISASIRNWSEDLFSLLCPFSACLPRYFNDHYCASFGATKRKNTMFFFLLSYELPTLASCNPSSAKVGEIVPTRYYLTEKRNSKKKIREGSNAEVGEGVGRL